VSGPTPSSSRGPDGGPDGGPDADPGAAPDGTVDGDREERARLARARRRRLIALAVPATATLVADPLLGMVDTAVVGRIGAAELGALGLAVTVLATVSWAFNFLVIGTTSTVARAVGAAASDGREPSEAGRHVTHAAQLALVIGVVVGALLWVAAPWLLTGLGAVDELIAPGTAYLRVRAIGLPLLLLTFVGHGAFRGVADTRTPLAIVAVANVVNVVLTIVLARPFGIVGAGAATVIAEAVTVAAFLWARSSTGLVLTGHGWVRREEVRAVLVVSRDLFLRTGGLLAGFLAIGAAAARIDATTAAAHQVVMQTFLLAAFAMDGIAIAGQTMVGAALGARDATEARAIGRSVLRVGLVGGTLTSVVLIVSAGWIPRLLTDEVEVLALVALVWPIAALVHIVGGPVFALDGVLMGASDYAYLRTWTLVGAGVGGVLAQAFVGRGGTIVTLWVAVQLMLVVRGVAAVLRLRGSAWTRVA
jgi:putative MATE family efflux protein